MNNSTRKFSYDEAMTLQPKTLAEAKDMLETLQEHRQILHARGRLSLRDQEIPEMHCPSELQDELLIEADPQSRYRLAEGLARLRSDCRYADETPQALRELLRAESDPQERYRIAERLASIRKKAIL